MSVSGTVHSVAASALCVGTAVYLLSDVHVQYVFALHAHVCTSGYWSSSSSLSIVKPGIQDMSNVATEMGGASFCWETITVCLFFFFQCL